jgi:hypothetical protein
MDTKRGTPEGGSQPEVDKLIALVRNCLTQPRSAAEALVRHIASLRSADWGSKLRKGPRLWERFCLEQLGCTAPGLQRILDGAAGLRAAGLLGSTVAQARAAAPDAGD